jgi:hypothetical protein
MLNAPICLFTSIRRPADAEAASYLRDCLHSWRMAGFDTVAVNGPAEIEALRGLDLPIEFAVTATDGKPRIGTILSAIQARGCRFAGIINSDCRVLRYPDLADNLKAGLERSAILAWRLDVSDDAKPAPMRFGFDAYFFDIEVAPRDDAGFSIGEPWWDLWFPLACELSGARVETLAVPALTHKIHPANWHERNWFLGGQRFWAAFQTGRRYDAIPKSLRARIPADWWKQDTLSPTRLGELSLLIPAWLHDCRPQTTSILGMAGADVENILRLGVRAMLAESHAASLAEELADLRNSTFWRLTAPLRTAVEAGRYFTSTLKARRQVLADNGRAPAPALSPSMKSESMHR